MEKVAGQSLAVCVEKVMHQTEDEIEFAGVIIPERQGDYWACSIGCRDWSVDRPTRQELMSPQNPAIWFEEPVQFIDLPGGSVDIGLHLGMNYPCQERQEDLVRGVEKLEPGIFEDPVVFPVKIVHPMLDDVAASCRVSRITRWQRVQVVETVQEDDLIEAPPPLAVHDT
nr:hypothetical protein [Planotetraspora thailandica]